MNIDTLHALCLGILQGLTEFLPVSSSAHLALFPRFFGWSDPGLAFDVALHLGTLAGVLVYFQKDLSRFVVALFRYQDPSYLEERKTVLYLIVSTVPGAVAGLLLEHKIETAFRSPILIACALILMGLGLAAADWLCTGQKRITDLTLPAVIGMGVAQALALIPGVSRSGITITVALALGFSRTEAARFSFLMSIPIIAGAGVLKSKELFHSPDKMALAVGFLSAAIAGLLAITILIRYVQKSRYTPFVIYRWILGIFVLMNISRFH